MKFSLIFIAMLVMAPAITFADESARPAPVPDREKLNAYLFEENRTYDDWFVNQKAVHFKDTYIWVYTEAFAKEFRMPAQWIDSALKGADAIAFSTKEAYPLCGWNGKSNSCRASSNCLIDIYFHQQRNPMPWNNSLRWTDLDFRSTSAFVLSSLQPVDRKQMNHAGVKSPFTDPENGNELLWWLVGIPGVSPIGGAAYLKAYDRSIFNNYSLVIADVSCDEVTGLELSADSPFSRSRKVLRSITLPKSWRDRIRPVMQKVSEGDRAFFNEKLKELQSGR